MGTPPTDVAYITATLYTTRKRIMNMHARVLSLLAIPFVLSALAQGCTDAPASFSEDGVENLSSSIFPLDPGSVWEYTYFSGNPIQANPFVIDNTEFPFPIGIDRMESRHFYYDDDEADKWFNYGPSTVWLPLPAGVLPPGENVGYLANDTMVTFGREFGERYDGKGILLENQRLYIPLNPEIGRRYRALQNAPYIGTEAVTLPVYTGPVHVFRSNIVEYLFAEGVGLVRYTFFDQGNPFSAQQITLRSYRIGP